MSFFETVSQCLKFKFESQTVQDSEGVGRWDHGNEVVEFHTFTAV